MTRKNAQHGLPAISALILFLGSSISLADPSLPRLFTDHMVLQRGRQIHIWGKAAAGEKIRVELAGQDAAATADSSGAWGVALPQMPAGGPFTLVVRGGKTIEIKDVMIGDVWLASGQSNMTFSLDGAEGAETEVPKANYPQIRLFTVPRRIALSPQDDTRPAQWQICTPDTARSFSAVAYYFAREIYRKEGIPIGVIESAWPGTAIESWIASSYLSSDPELKPLVDEWERTTPEQKAIARSEQPFELEFDDFELVPATTTGQPKVLATFDSGSSRLTTGGSFSYSWSESPDAALELHSPGRGNSGRAMRVAGNLDGTHDSILSATYRLDGSPLDLTQYSGIRFWVRGNGSFQFRSLQPTISDYDDYGVKIQHASPEWQPITVKFSGLRQDGWGVVKPLTVDALSGFRIECLTALEYPPIPVSGLYEGMITPLLAYGMRGALWYQGESNALRAHQYRKLLPALIRNWREASHQSDLQFLIVQLPNHGAIPDEPGDSAWAELREAELLTVKQVPDTGLAVTIDVGDPKDLHPHRKREVGERLATWALGTIYKEPIEYSGPLYDALQVRGNEARVSFTHTGAGLEAHDGAQLQGFAIAGADRKFHWAQARIEGGSVIVSSTEVPNPVAVRYAWGDSPRCNLFNREGLPASPFRTDDWPGITEGH